MTLVLLNLPRVNPERWKLQEESLLLLPQNRSVWQGARLLPPRGGGGRVVGARQRLPREEPISEFFGIWVEPGDHFSCWNVSLT